MADKNFLEKSRANENWLFARNIILSDNFIAFFVPTLETKVENDRGRTFYISMQHTGTQKVFFIKIKISFTQSGLTSLEKSEKSFVYTNTRFAGETIESKGYFNTSFFLTAYNLNFFISNDPIEAFRHNQVRLEFSLFNENQMLGSGWTAVIPLESSGISFPGNVKLLAIDTFSFAPLG